VTTLVDKLIALDYVEKVKDDPDSRVTLVKLTEQGKALKPDFEEISARLLSKVYEGISAEEQQGLVALLSRIRNNF
jgi:DNA-binding MarR family transcriptional regulator